MSYRAFLYEINNHFRASDNRYGDKSEYHSDDLYGVQLFLKEGISCGGGDKHKRAVAYGKEYSGRYYCRKRNIESYVYTPYNSACKDEYQSLFIKLWRGTFADGVQNCSEAEKERRGDDRCRQHH